MVSDVSCDWDGVSVWEGNSKIALFQVENDDFELDLDSLCSS